jgi:hypothetical protein
MISPLDKDVALFSIWLHPSSVLPSKRETVAAGSASDLRAQATEPAATTPASFTNSRRLMGFVSVDMRLTPGTAVEN